MNIIIYGTKTCNVCKMVKNRLEENKIDFSYIDDDEVTMTYAAKAGISTVPIIEIDGTIYSTQDALKKIL